MVTVLMRNTRKIKDILNKEEILAQLAEEAAELAQAALKLRRAIDGINPTPITMDAAESSLLEEASDVMLVLECLGIDANDTVLRSIQDEKAERWVRRLHENSCFFNEKVVVSKIATTTQHGALAGKTKFYAIQMAGTFASAKGK